MAFRAGSAARKAIVLLPNGQTPLLQKMDGVVDVASHVIDQVFPGQSHHVVHDIIDEVFRGIPAVALTHIAVNGGEPFSGGPAPLDNGLFHHDHPEISAPVLRLECSTAAGHTSADDQDVAIDGFCSGQGQNTRSYLLVN